MASRVCRRAASTPGARLEEAFATEQPAELRGDEQREQHVERGERRGHVGHAERERQSLRRTPRRRRRDERAAGPAGEHPAEESDHDEVREEDPEVEIRKRNQAGKDRISAAEQGAEDHYQHDDDEHDAQHGPPSAARHVAGARREELPQRQWQRTDEDVAEHPGAGPHRIAEPSAKQCGPRLAERHGGEAEGEQGGEEVECLQFGRVAPREPGGRDHGDHEPSARLAGHGAFATTGEGGCCEGHDPDPDREGDADEAAAKEGVGGDPDE